MRLRIPITIPRGRPLRVCSVARFSTDEQKKRRRSNVSQHKFNRKEVASWKLKTVEFTEIEDEAVSGEVKERPGIWQLREGIRSRSLDLIVCEDSSRLYRNGSFCYELVALAVDHGIRIICIGDDVDTAEDDWVDRLAEAQQHHCKDNKYTRRRIKRAHQDLWEMGAAVGALLGGYKRRPTKPATDREAAEGPFFDEIDTEQATHVLKAFEMIAQRNHPESVADYLTEHEVPKRDGKRSKWTGKNVINMIRREIYRGVERRGDTVTRKILSTGVSKQVENDPDQIQFRNMPHLRIVADSTWYKANKAIDDRRKGPGPSSGPANPMHGVPRDSQTPMSNLFYCGICSQKMYCIGQSYGCSCARNRTRRLELQKVCWNRAMVSRALAHNVIYQTVIEAMVLSEAHLQVLLDFVRASVADDRGWKHEEARLSAQVSELERRCQRLTHAIESRDEPPETIVKQIESLERRKDESLTSLWLLREQHAQPAIVPSREELLRACADATAHLATTDRQSRDYLCRLLRGPIQAVPYLQLNSNRVVLYAEFELNLVKLLPEQLADRLRGENAHAMTSEHLAIKRSVELFHRPRYVVRAIQVVEAMRVRGLTLKAAFKELGLARRDDRLAWQLAEAMFEEGLTDAYVRLTEAPASASRWRANERRGAS